MFTKAELNVLHALVHELRTDSIGLLFKEKNKDTLKSLSKKLNSQESHEDYCKRMTEKYGEDWADDDFYDDPSEDFLIRTPKS